MMGEDKPTKKKKYKKSIQQKEKEKIRKREIEKEKKKKRRERKKELEKQKKKTHKRFLKKLREKRRAKRKEELKALRKLNKVPSNAGRKPYNYRVVNARNGYQYGILGKFKTLDEAVALFEKLKEEPKPLFPRKKSHNGKLLNLKLEYLLLGNKKVSVSNNALKNDIGKIVEHNTTSTKWVILDKAQREIEEEFWIYGYHSFRERKTFGWIYENLIKEKSVYDKYNIIRIYRHGNKIVFKDDYLDCEIIICKDREDGKRFYQTISKMIKDNKIQNVFCAGDSESSIDLKRSLLKDIMEKTGWTKKKVYRMNTSSY